MFAFELNMGANGSWTLKKFWPKFKDSVLWGAVEVMTQAIVNYKRCRITSMNSLGSLLSKIPSSFCSRIVFGLRQTTKQMLKMITKITIIIEASLTIGDNFVATWLHDLRNGRIVRHIYIYITYNLKWCTLMWRMQLPSVMVSYWQSVHLHLYGLEPGAPGALILYYIIIILNWKWKKTFYLCDILHDASNHCFDRKLCGNFQNDIYIRRVHCWSDWIGPVFGSNLNYSYICFDDVLNHTWRVVPIKLQPSVAQINWPW